MYDEIGTRDVECERYSRGTKKPESRSIILPNKSSAAETLRALSGLRSEYVARNFTGKLGNV